MNRTPLKRKTRLRAVSKTNSYRRRERDFAYMDLVRRLPCMVRVALELDREPAIPARGEGVRVTPCGGRLEADHVGVRALSQKSPDHQTAPMCHSHHGERTDVRGFFRGWTALQMRAWCDWAIEYATSEVNKMKGIDA